MFLVGPGGLAGELQRPAVFGGAAVGLAAPPPAFGFGFGAGFEAELGAGGITPTNTNASMLSTMLQQPPIEITAPSPDNALDQKHDEEEDQEQQTLLSAPDLPYKLNQLDAMLHSQAMEQTVALVHREAEGTG